MEKAKKKKKTNKPRNREKTTLWENRLQNEKQKFGECLTQLTSG